GLKLALASKLLSAGAPDAPRRTLRSFYFDTSSGDLRKHGITLRVRNMRRAYVMGLKWAAPAAEKPLSRGEVEVRVPTANPEIAVFGAESASELNRLTKGRTLEQQFETQMKRRSRRLGAGEWGVDAAFD